MRQRTRTLQAWLLFAATLACLLGGLVVTLAVVRPLTTEVIVNGAFEGSFWLLFATIGLILTLRRPANPIGWLYAAAGVVWSAYIPADPWVDQLQRTGRPVPLVARYLALIGENFWAIGIVLAIILPLLLLPDGRLRSPRWRPVAVAAIAATAVQIVAACLDPAPTTQTMEPLAKPFAVHGWPGTVAAVIGWTGFGIMFACVPAAALCAVLRFRGSRGVERQQLRWVAFGAAASVVGPLLAIGLAALGVLPSEDAFSWPLLLSVPLAIAVAVLRYRLWDLDRLISRTVAYALVTALLLIPYLLILPAAATTPPAPSTPSRPGCATSSTWTPSTASCWGWSSRPCNRRGRRCGCGRILDRSSSQGRVTGMGRLDGKVAVITGAASGIGRESARRFAAEGARVCVADLSDEAGEAVAAEVDGLYLHADVTDEDDVRAMYERAAARYGGIDVLFNNAGIAPPDDVSVLDTSLEAWQRVQDVNLRAVFLCCKHGIPHLLGRGGGSVINTASFVAVMGAATSQISYTASKGGVLALSRELGVEFGRRSVRVNALCPGPVNTPLLQELFAKDQEKAARRLVHLPMGRFAEAAEIAAAACFLASDDASYVTASTFLVDGGLSSAYVTPVD